MKFSFLKSLTIKTKYYLITAIALIISAVIIALVVYINNNNEDANVKPDQLTLSLIKDKNFLNKVNQETQKEKDIILVDAAKILLTEIHTVTDNKHKDFVLTDFNNVNPIIDFILVIDPKNGHAIYFKGEVYRLLNDNDRFLEYFQLYLEIENSIGNQLPRVTDTQLCYETPDGYCEQRTAWISQLLANYYYKKGSGESDINRKLDLHNIAMKYLQKVRIHFPNGFVSSSVTLSTFDLETKLKAIISN